MREKKEYSVVCFLLLLFLTGMGTWLLVRTPDTYSQSERRVLAGKQKLSIYHPFSRESVRGLEEYALDQFPCRDTFRRIKAETEYHLFQKEDSNGIYLAEGHLSKMEYPLRRDMVGLSGQRMYDIYQKYLKNQGIRPYLTVIPDKNYYLAQKYGILEMDYDELYESMQQLQDFNYIEIRDLLEISDYYNTDTHWRQECILDVAERIGQTMGVHPQPVRYQTVILDIPFYGVYAGQSALAVQPDQLQYLTNQMLQECTVTSYDTGQPVAQSFYNQKKAEKRDAYDIFLGGAAAVLIIENPSVSTMKELVIFRDSFGSSLAPLLVKDYRKITLIDLRYVQSGELNSFVRFENQEVVFLYSTLLINQGLAFRT